MVVLNIAMMVAGKGQLEVLDWENKDPQPVCYVDGEFTVKRLKVENECIYLMPENKKYKALKITEENQLIIWGVVTYVIKKL